MTDFELSASGTVLDGSAISAWASGSMAMATWAEIAWSRHLTFEVPEAALNEALVAAPSSSPTITHLLSGPEIVVRERPESARCVDIADRLHRDGVFDPMASWVVGISRERGWSALTTDPARLRRIDPDVDCDVV